MDIRGGSCFVRFQNNHEWTGFLSDLEILDKRKGNNTTKDNIFFSIALKYSLWCEAVGTFWTAGRRTKNNRWVWTLRPKADGSVANQPLVYKNWYFNEPKSNEGRDCLEIRFHKRSGWFASKCDKKNYFICKREPDSK